MPEYPLFMTPEQVAERLGDAFNVSNVRNLARRTGFHSRGPNRRVIFTEENFRDLVNFIKNPPMIVSFEEIETGEIDPFADDERMPRLGDDLTGPNALD